MSYQSDAHDDLKRILDAGRLSGKDKIPVVAMVAHLNRAIIFKLPVNGIIFPGEAGRGGTHIDSIGRYDAKVRLPYSEVILEFANEPTGGEARGSAFTKVVCIASDMNGVGAIQDYVKLRLGESASEYAIAITGAFYSPEHRMWMPNGFTLMMKDDGMTKVFSNFSYTEDVSKDDAYNDVYGETSSVVMLMCALSCSNVSIEKVAAPDAVNKKRIKCGKKPIRDHHILVLGSKSQGERSLGGTHASPRVHLRRGHIRRLEQKNIWVNACVVGNKKLGTVTKDYMVKQR